MRQLRHFGEPDGHGAAGVLQGFPGFLRDFGGSGVQDGWGFRVSGVRSLAWIKGCSRIRVRGSRRTKEKRQKAVAGGSKLVSARKRTYQLFD